MRRKNVLCFGDSNTFGFMPGTAAERYEENIRWTGILAQQLGPEYRIIDEGLNGRTTMYDDPLAPVGVNRNGYAVLPTLLETHRPLDLVIIFLGTNDHKVRVGVGPMDTALGIERLVEIARKPEYGYNGQTPAILVICPAILADTHPILGPQFSGGGEKAKTLAQCLKTIAPRSNLDVLYAGEYVQADPADGIHLSPESHAILARVVGQKILDILNGAKKNK